MNTHKRYRELMSILQNPTKLGLLSVLRELNELSKTKELSFGDRKLLDEAKRLLATQPALLGDS